MLNKKGKRTEKSSVALLCKEEWRLHNERSKGYHSQIEATASFLRQCYELTSPVAMLCELKEIAAAFGIEVLGFSRKVYKSYGLPPDLVGIYAKLNGRKVILVLNEADYNDKKEYLAHELGHFFCADPDISQKEKYSSIANARLFYQKESIAEHFARSLIIDHISLRKDLHDKKFRLVEIAQDYNVPYTMLAWRAIVVADFDLHLLVVDKDGAVVESYSADTPDMQWMTIDHVCKMWSSYTCLKMKNRDKKIVSQFSVFPNNKRYFCFSVRVDDNKSVTIGCLAGDHKKIGYSLDETVVSLYVSSGNCPHKEDDDKYCDDASCLKNFTIIKEIAERLTLSKTERKLTQPA